jgi:predicted metal-dependent HD superfamily phosphohydrolase
VAVGVDLWERWGEPHRQYHTRTHLGAVLRVVDAHAALADDPDAVRLATWYHDAVYDPRGADNEGASAELAATTLARLGLDAGRIAEVARLVRLTAGHRAEPDDANGRLLCDADLAVLAGAPDAYDAYAAAVRREYAHVPDGLFRAGRSAVLRHLHDLPELYRVVPDRAAWESRARANLARELTSLMDSAP